MGSLLEDILSLGVFTERIVELGEARFTPPLLVDEELHILWLLAANVGDDVDDGGVYAEEEILNILAGDAVLETGVGGEDDGELKLPSGEVLAGAAA